MNGEIQIKFCFLFSFHSEKNCPQCRKPITENIIHPIYLEIEQSGISEQVLMTRIADLTITIENRDKKLMDSLEKITISMSAFEYQNEMLKKQNNELREMMKGLENENKSVVTSKQDSAAMKEQIKVKDLVISNLQKEVNALKSQRAETTREMNDIHEQINQLKATAKGESKRAPLKDSNDQQRSFTLKFDNFNDKL